jgi:hypothetical protein
MLMEKRDESQKKPGRFGGRGSETNDARAKCKLDIRPLSLLDQKRTCERNGLLAKEKMPSYVFRIDVPRALVGNVIR